MDIFVSNKVFIVEMHETEMFKNALKMNKFSKKNCILLNFVLSLTHTHTHTQTLIMKFIKRNQNIKDCCERGTLQKTTKIYRKFQLILSRSSSLK